MPSGFLSAPKDLMWVFAQINWPILVACLRDAHANAAEQYFKDGYLDAQMYGVVVALGLGNRLREAAERDAIGFVPATKNDRWEFALGRHRIHCHRAERKSLVPITGDKVKSSARVVADIAPDLFPEQQAVVGRHLVIAYVATPETGVERVSLIELVQVRDTEVYGHVYAPLDVLSDHGQGFGDGVGETPPELTRSPIVSRDAAKLRTPRPQDVQAPDQTGTEND